MAEMMEIDSDAYDENANTSQTDKDVDMDDLMSPRRKKRLQFLLNQAEIFSHFVGNSPKQQKKQQKQPHQAGRIQNSTKNRHSNEQPSDDESPAENGNRIQFDATPSYIKAVMRDYQLRGLNWLISLYDSNVNGILADEMGLGKTIQSISILGFLKNYKHINGPFLVIGPKSTLRNWYNEVNRFCPSLKPLVLIGDKKERSEIVTQMGNSKEWDVLLTTYEICLQEKAALRRHRWQYLVVDEAHRLKNENSKLSTILRSLNTKNRLLLTGTPLQNNLHELWALLNFLLPEVFASADDFDTWFDSDDCLRGNNEIVRRLHDILRPFMLRRIKAEVEKSLLPKIELKLFVGLTPLQHETYKKVLSKNITKLNAFGEESMKAISMIIQELRKAANHPYLVEGIEEIGVHATDQHLIDNCGKMMVLDKLLDRLKSQGHRVVLFSQFVIMLDILEDYLLYRGYNYRRLDGNTSYEVRGTSIDEFNAENSDIFIFIISTRAGGLGINLATADTVIIYDSDWNPQPDLQAIDRVHRIGQKKQVRVFRLIAENTIDERIVQRAEIKKRLDKMIIQQGRTVDKNLTETTAGMKRDMIRFGLEQIMLSKETGVLDVDIDKILKEGELKTAEENSNFDKMGEDKLRALTLEEASSVSVYQFEGVDFRTMTHQKEEDLAYRFRKRTLVNYAPPAPAPVVTVVKRNLKHIHDFQFFPRELYDLSENGYVDLNEDKHHRLQLFAQGFSKWRRSDVTGLIRAMVIFGRNDLKRIATLLPEKPFDEVCAYHSTFWARGKLDIKNFDTLIAPIKKAEGAEQKEKELSEAFHWKMSSSRYPKYRIKVKHVKLEQFTHEQNTLLLGLLFKYGIEDPTVYNRIRLDLLNSPKTKFDWFLRNRTQSELKRHIRYLLMLIHREYAEEKAKDAVPSPSRSSPSPPEQLVKEEEVAIEPARSSISTSQPEKIVKKKKPRLSLRLRLSTHNL